VCGVRGKHDEGLGAVGLAFPVDANCTHGQRLVVRGADLGDLGIPDVLEVHQEGEALGWYLPIEALVVLEIAIAVQVPKRAVEALPADPGRMQAGLEAIDDLLELRGRYLPVTSPRAAARRLGRAPAAIPSCAAASAIPIPRTDANTRFKT
jgi:hypothetical protein